MTRNKSTGATNYGIDRDGHVDTVGDTARARENFGGMNLGALLAAMAGGKVGHHYHDKVDRAGVR